MANKFMTGLQNATNFTHTENGAITHRTTESDLLDMFALGGAMRTRSDEDVILMFRKAFAENPVYALKCLFYMRDVRGGQGERRFFRVIVTDMAKNKDTRDAIARNMEHIPVFGRWDDLYAFVGTPLEKNALDIMYHQLALDVQCKTPSLLAKWLKSENTSSAKSRTLATKTRVHFGMTSKQYRKTLSTLRERINVLECLMSAGKWDEIEFDKIPSRAGMIYKNAFARHDIERMRMDKEVISYADFAKSEDTKVNAKALYPYECVAEALKCFRTGSYYTVSMPALNDTNRMMVNKYWDNLADYFNGANFNGLAVVDTSGSMVNSKPDAPINVAISLGMYCAEKAKGPFAGKYISFASRPQLIDVEGVDFVDKVYRIYKTNLVDNTNIELTFDLLLDTAIRNDCTQDELPQNIIIISDMEFDSARGAYNRGWGRDTGFTGDTKTLMEKIAQKWAAHGYIMPRLTFWNVQARQNNIPMKAENGVNFVSGMSPVIFEQIMKGKDAYTLMMDKLNSARYEVIQ